MVDFDNIVRVEREAHTSQYQNRCHSCKRPVNPENETWDNKGNWYHMDCYVPCSECHGLRGDRAGICRTCNGSGAQEAADARLAREQDSALDSNPNERAEQMP